MGVGDEGRLVSQSVETGARAPRTQALTSSNKQRDTEQTADTKHPHPNRAAPTLPPQPPPPRFNPNNRRVFSLGGAPAEDQPAHQTPEEDEEEEGAPLQFVILDRTPKKNKQAVGIGFEVVRGRVIHDITGIGSTT